jgi:ankyrin repeat protein
MPTAVTELEEAVDQTTDSARWVTASSQTLEAMKDAGILPSSNQANKILHRAVIYGKADAVRELLSAGVPITGESKPKGEIEMWTPSGSLLDDVARYSYGSTSGKEVIAALLENPSVRANKPDLQRALGKAASEGQVEIVRMLIAAGADPQASFQDTYNADEKPADQTFLMRAVESGVWSMIDDALSRPHDIHAVDHDGHALLRRVIAGLVTLGPGENPQECRVATCDPMAEDKTANEHRDTGKNRVEEIECANRANADEVKERAFDAKISEGLVQAFEDSVTSTCTTATRPCSPRAWK